MKIFRSEKVLWGMLAVVIVSAVFLAVSERADVTPAAAQSQLAELEGWAWAANAPPPVGVQAGGVGWISFNSSNNPPGGAMPSFAVRFDTVTGSLSGHAWAENGGAQSGGFGWLSFNRSETGAPPIDDTCNTRPGNPTACFNSSGTVLQGWARFLTACQSPFVAPCSSSGSIANRGGWDGWVKFSGAWLNGVTISGTEFSGYAWGSDNVGWVSFKHPTNGCASYCVKKKYDFSIRNEGDKTVRRGATATNIITVTNNTGNPQNITFSGLVNGLAPPANLQLSFSPASCIPNTICTTTLTMSTLSSLSAGPYTITVNGSDGSAVKQTSFILTVTTIPSCGLVLLNGGPVSAEAGNSATNRIDVYVSEGTCGPVTFSSAGHPDGDPTFNPASCTPSPNPCFTNMIIPTLAGTPPGIYPMTVTGVAGSDSNQTNFNMTVTIGGGSGVLGDFELHHRPYESEPGLEQTCLNGVSGCKVQHNPGHFVRDIAIATSHSTNTVLRIKPIDNYADASYIEVISVEKDNMPPKSPCIAGDTSCSGSYPANGIGDVEDCSLGNFPCDNTAAVPLNQFSFKFNGLISRSSPPRVSGVAPNTGVLFNVIRESALDGRYVIKLRATSTTDPTKVSETRIVLVVGANVPGYQEI